VIARLRWALVKTTWLTAAAGFLAAAYTSTGPRFY
jgi:hypothetical protein